MGTLSALVACGSDAGRDDASVRADGTTTVASTTGDGKVGQAAHRPTTSEASDGHPTGPDNGSGPRPTDTTRPTDVLVPPPIQDPAGTTTTLFPGATTTTTPDGCTTGRPLSNTTTLSTGGAAAGREVDVSGVGLMIGHSNGQRIFPPFIQKAAEVSDFPWVMASQPGEDSAKWANTDQPWNEALARLGAAGWTPADVEVVVGVLSRRTTRPDSMAVIDGYRDRDLPTIMARLEQTFPNLELVYLEPREAGRFSPVTNGEPAAYRHSIAALEFANSYEGRTTVLVGPYLWDDATCLRADGLSTVRSDFEADGIHPAPTGADKYADAMLQYFLTHPSATPWF